jgi:hypothetical protein
MSRPLNYTTKIAARQTAQECVDLLADAGADHVEIKLAGREPAGLSFALDTPLGRRDFRLPLNVEGMQKRLAHAEAAGEFASLRKRAGAHSTREHAARVAWRVCRDWLAATVALIAAEMVSVDEAFTAYRVLPAGPHEGLTVYEAINRSETDALALTAPDPR